MKTLVFASNNAHKLQEIRSILGSDFIVKSLIDIGLQGDIPETAPTLEGNALQKAQWVYERTQLDCFADDTGLEVDALGGEPGVRTARYAGEHCTPDDNIDKLLLALKDTDNRKARFRTAICLIENGKAIYFNGIVNGEILKERCGKGGFGYDPVFMPERFAVSFAEMPEEVKNSISHRGRATAQMKEYLTGK